MRPPAKILVYRAKMDGEGAVQASGVISGVTVGGVVRRCLAALRGERTTGLLTHQRGLPLRWIKL